MRFLKICLLIGFVVGMGCQRNTNQTLPNSVKLSGNVTNGGEPLTVDGYEVATGWVAIGFHPIIDGEPINETSTARADDKGNFDIVEGIEPGEYLITIRQWEPYPSKDLLKGKFAPNKSKIRRTIEGDTVLNLDVSNDEG